MPKVWRVWYNCTTCQDQKIITDWSGEWDRCECAKETVSKK